MDGNCNTQKIKASHIQQEMYIADTYCHNTRIGQPSQNNLEDAHM